ncbi:hypothetical protein, partial [Vagococcus acidifermentans]|uniref:hypothetical protein n=1 Tax=Vagococcus acidifermentans TaxID=564710 RepID=UPI001B8830D3
DELNRDYFILFMQICHLHSYLLAQVYLGVAADDRYCFIRRLHYFDVCQQFFAFKLKVSVTVSLL